MTWLRDTTERVAVTFVQAWLGAWLAIAGALDLDDLSTELQGPVGNLFAEGYLLAGLVGAVAALLKCLAATRFGSRESASLAG